MNEKSYVTVIEDIKEKNLKTINDGVFRGCSSLKSITLPKTLEYIGDANFDY